MAVSKKKTMRVGERGRASTRQPHAAQARVQRKTAHSVHRKTVRLLKALVVAWDADQDLEFDEAIDAAREHLGFKLAAPIDYCAVGCGHPVRDFGLVCGECRDEDEL